MSLIETCAKFEHRLQYLPSRKNYPRKHDNIFPQRKSILFSCNDWIPTMTTTISSMWSAKVNLQFPTKKFTALEESHDFAFGIRSFQHTAFPYFLVVMNIQGKNGYNNNNMSTTTRQQQHVNNNTNNNNNNNNNDNDNDNDNNNNNIRDNNNNNNSNNNNNIRDDNNNNNNIRDNNNNNTVPIQTLEAFEKIP